MGRITRAKAAELSESITHTDEDLLPDQFHGASNKLPTIAEDERAPLVEIASNRVGTVNGLGENGSVTNPGRARKGANRKGTRCSSKKKMADDLDAMAPDAPSREPIIIPDENELPPSPASESASEDLMKAVPELDMSNMPTHDIKQASPPSNAVRLTRHQLGTTSNSTSGKTSATELCNQLAILAASIDESLEPTECDFDEPTELLEPLSESTVTSGLGKSANYPESEDTLSSSSRPTIKRQSGDGLSLSVAFEGTGEILNTMSGEPMTPYDELEAAAVEAQTPPRSSRSSSATTAPTSVSDAASDNLDCQNGEPPEKTRSKSFDLIVRTTKASKARIELAHGPRDRVQAPSLGRPTVSNRVASSSSTCTTGSNEGLEKKEVIIPHSKPRPMSMAFPTPPPPPKSTKAPTQSNFQLPGEAVAAKLKATKEARLQKDVEDQKKKAFKARPIPASVVKGAAVRQTNTSKAREILITGSKPVPADPRPVTNAAGNSAMTSRSTSRNPHPHETTITGPPAPPTKSSSSSSPSSITTTSSSSRPSTSQALHRPTTAASIPRSRTPSVTSTRPASTVPGGVRPNGTAKGKEVWHRTAFALEAVEREKKEKEDAARKARAEAAERGRLASREWAEKQRVRKMVAQMEANASPVRQVVAS